MPRRNSTTEIKDGKVVFSKEVLEYFESIRTEENSVWIDKYFEYLSDEENLSAEKYNIHHIRPCFSFKDENHKNRKQTKPLGDKFNGNLIKLSIHNHLFAHYCLWKIFDNWDSKKPFQVMCYQEKCIDNLTENEIKEIGKLLEECTKKNQTEEEKKEKIKKYHQIYDKENSDKIKKYKKEWYEKNSTEIKRKRKENYENNRESILEQQKQSNIKNSDKIKKRKKEWQIKNREEISKKKKLRYENNREEILKQKKIYGSQICYDPIKKDHCKLSALLNRKHRNKELYRNIIPSECIIHDLPNISS